MSVFFILRVHFVFYSSSLRIKAQLLLAILSLPVVSTILFCVSGIGGPLHVFGEHDFTIPSRIGFSGGIVNIFTDLLVTALYAERLIRVVMMQSEVSQTQQSGAAGELETVVVTKVTLSEKHIVLITKSSLLNLIAVISSLAVQIKACQMFLTDTNDPFLTKAMVALDSAVNAWCMFLVFPFASVYYKFMCQIPHRLLRKFCKGMAKRIVLRREDTKAQETSRTI